MNPLRGILLKLGSVTIFVVMAALIKATADEVPAGQQVFFRSFFAIPVILIWLIRRGEFPRGLRTARPMGHVFRGLVGTAAMGLGFAGLGLLPLPEVTAIGFAAPLLTVIFAAMFLGEDVRAFRLATVALGLIGVLVILSPRLGQVGDGLSTAETLGAVITLMGAMCAALAQIFVRKLVSQETTAAIVFWFSVTASVLALFTVPFGWVLPSPDTAALLILAGLLGGLGQILLTSAYRFADASLVAPFDYAAMLFALLIGYGIFGEVPSATMLTGASIVIAAGVLIIWREHRLGLERNRQRKAMSPQG
ncbi:DMT family transporter [Paracoccus sp. M683]|uniref:DMT family transporter n=1 Tax=Paracoccus sp. M683 TaxID=2594268 RepID=UPI00117CB7D9|nr:DMT family transporter [Paracoccus sp. M683]TRW99431.1 DMT family transporter [Paracoccus sp. M683]